MRCNELFQTNTKNYWLNAVQICVVPKTTTAEDGTEVGEDDEDGGADKGIFKLTKAERRSKLKRSKKEAKKKGQELATPEEVRQPPQAAVLVPSQLP